MQPTKLAHDDASPGYFANSHRLWRHHTSSISFATDEAAIARAADANVDAAGRNTLSEAMGFCSSDHPPLNARIRDVDVEVQMRFLHYSSSPELVENDGRAFQRIISHNQTTGLPYGVKKSHHKQSGLQ